MEYQGLWWTDENDGKEGVCESCSELIKDQEPYWTDNFGDAYCEKCVPEGE